MAERERFLKANDIFRQAVEEDALNREHYIASACVGDEALQQEVLCLLRGDLQATEWEETVRVTIEEQLKLLQSTEASSQYPIGETLGGRYLIQSKIGQGGIGAVYLASDTRLYSRQVVVKLLLDKSSGDQYLVNKFKHEGESLARIKHPGVVSVIDLGTLPDHNPYLVMEFVGGKTLGSEIHVGGMELRRSAILIRQITQALTAAHYEGVVHRDLKPANVMIQDLRDGTEQIKLIDFGIAKIANPQSADVTQAPVIAVSPAYAAPEQLERGEASPQSDIYSCGVIFYEMLTGHRPFPVDTTSPSWRTELANMQRAGVSTKPKQLRPELPNAAQTEILTALAYDPRQRHQRPFEFGERVYRALIGDHRPEPPDINLASLAHDVSDQPPLLFDSGGPNTEPVSQAVRAFERLWSNSVFTDRIRPLALEDAKEERKRQVRGLGGKPKRAQYSYRLSTELCLALDIKRDGYLTLLDEGPEGLIYCLCPSQFAPNTRLESGRVYLPQAASPHPAFELSGTPGKEKLLAIISDQSLGLDWLPKDAETPSRELSSDDIELLFARLQQLGEGGWTALSAYFEVTG